VVAGRRLVNVPDAERALAPSPPAEVVARRAESVRMRIEQAGADSDAVRIVAVTKGFSAEAVSAALGAGVGDVGENYADELVSKAHESQMGPGASLIVPCWHYLGVIQRRRVKDMADLVGVWQTVSRFAEAEQIALHAPGARVMIQIEATGLAGRNGCSVREAGDLATRCRQVGLDLCGLMTIAPPGSPSAARSVFRTVARLAGALEVGELSMGMTDDLELAVEAGATMVRVGRALFGERHTAPKS
jgi:PLP dependent protein